MYRRYPIAPIVAWILRILAILLLATFVYTFTAQLVEITKNWALISAQQGFASQFVSFIVDLVMKGLVPAVVLWAAGDILLAVRDIEYNTRVNGAAPLGTAPAAASAQPVVETGTDGQAEE